MPNTYRLSDVVAETESAGKIDAMRFEPSVFQRLAPQRNIVRYGSTEIMTLETSRVLGSMSFGAYQIMGYNLYGVCQYARPLTEYLTNESQQLFSFAKFIEHGKFDDNEFEVYVENNDLLLRFSKFYNGSEHYASSLLASYHKLKNQ